MAYTFELDTTVSRYIPKKVLPHVVDCYKDSDGYWAVCEKGWHFSATECHTAHGTTVQEFRDDVRSIEQVENDWD